MWCVRCLVHGFKPATLQICSVVRWLFGCGLDGLLVVLIVLGDAGPLLLFLGTTGVSIHAVLDRVHSVTRIVS